MPRTTQQIIDHAEELAARFEHMEPGDEPEVTPLGELYFAVQERAAAERLVNEKVAAAKKAGSTWAVIGQMLGTSDEAARQRYGPRSNVTPMRRDSGRPPFGGRQAPAAAKRYRSAAATSVEKTYKEMAVRSGRGAASKSTRRASGKSSSGAAAKKTTAARGASAKKSTGTRGRRSK